MRLSQDAVLGDTDGEGAAGRVWTRLWGTGEGDGSWPNWVGLLGTLGRVIVTAMMAPNT